MITHTTTTSPPHRDGYGDSFDAGTGIVYRGLWAGGCLSEGPTRLQLGTPAPSANGGDDDDNAEAQAAKAAAEVDHAEQIEFSAAPEAARVLGGAQVWCAMVQPKGEGEGEGEQPPVDAAEEGDLEGEGGGKVAEKGSKSSDGDAATDGKAGEEEAVIWEPCVHESGRLLRLCIVREEQGEPSVGDDGVETPGPVTLVEVPFLYPVEATEEEKAEAAAAEAEAAAEAAAGAAAEAAAQEGGKEGEGSDGKDGAGDAAEDSSEHKDAELKSDESGGGGRSGDMNTTPPLKLVRSACVRTVDGAALFLPLELPSPRPEEDGEDADEGKGGGGEGGEGGEGGDGAGGQGWDF